MNLKTFITENNMTYEQMAQDIDVSPVYLSAVGRGYYIPSKKLSDKIKEYTGGQVDFGIEGKAKKYLRKNKRVGKMDIVGSMKISESATIYFLYYLSPNASGEFDLTDMYRDLYKNVQDKDVKIIAKILM